MNDLYPNFNILKYEYLFEAIESKNLNRGKLEKPLKNFKEDLLLIIFIYFNLLIDRNI